MTQGSKPDADDDDDKLLMVTIRKDACDVHYRPDISRDVLHEALVTAARVIGELLRKVDG